MIDCSLTPITFTSAHFSRLRLSWDHYLQTDKKMINLLLDALPKKQKGLTINRAEGARSAADVLNRMGCKERLLGRSARVLEGMNACSPSGENHSSLFSGGKRLTPFQHTTGFPPEGRTRTSQVS